MNEKIPKQLHNPDFRFYLLAKNKKLPMEKRWNTDNNYMFFEDKVQDHIKNGGNIGICTGYGKLIVIDFDDRQFQNKCHIWLPKTFTTRTAGKGLKHKYYYLKGKMINKIGIGNEPRLADIQAARCGIVCPPSRIDRKYYSIVDDSPIAEIDCNMLSKVFKIDKFQERSKKKFDKTAQPDKVQKMLELFKLLKIERTNKRHFKCPFHTMAGGGNLWVADNGSAHCFHCGRNFRDNDDFMIKYEKVYGIK